MTPGPVFPYFLDVLLRLILLKNTDFLSFNFMVRAPILLLENVLLDVNLFKMAAKMVK